jgi:hypothetical protein
MALKEVKVQRANVITPQNARAFFKAVKNEGNLNMVEQLTHKVAKAQNPDITVKELGDAAEKIFANIGEKPSASVRLEPEESKEEYVISLPKSIGLSINQKVLYGIGLVTDAFLFFSVAAVATRAVPEKTDTFGGVVYNAAILAGAFVAGMVGAVALTKSVIKTWKGRTAAKLQNIADVLESTIIAALPPAQAKPKE